MISSAIASKPVVAVITHLASPYQVELFDAVAALGQIDLHVIYLHRKASHRNWTAPQARHRTIFLDETSDNVFAARQLVQDASLVVVNSYSESRAFSLFRTRVATGRPWVFWGERPGFRVPDLPGRILRNWTLRWLHRSRSPIWGIGHFGVDGYRAEFGAGRAYVNLPYFSDLGRFWQTADKRSDRRTERVVLFSGALIRRKGIDLLARAFVKIARSRPELKFHVLGDGELRSAVEGVLAPVASQVKIFGFRDWDALPQHYGEADILCVPSRYDGWGLVVPEGLAAGLPVIATDRMGAAREFLTNGQNGWLLPEGREEAVEEALIEAAALSPDQLASMSAVARESMRDHTLEKGATRFVAAARAAMTLRDL